MFSNVTLVDVENNSLATAFSFHFIIAITALKVKMIASQLKIKHYYASKQ
jgi:hypothetical protein